VQRGEVVANHHFARLKHEMQADVIALADCSEIIERFVQIRRQGVPYVHDHLPGARVL
jgi:hypothetical protein